jgi:hypothetical protein
VDRINCALDCNQWLPLLDTVMNLWDPYYVRIVFLDVRLSRRDYENTVFWHVMPDSVVDVHVFAASVESHSPIQTGTARSSKTSVNMCQAEEYYLLGYKAV